MSRAYMDLRKYRSKATKIWKEEESHKLFNAILSERETDKTFAMVSRFVRFNAQPFSELKKLFINSLQEIIKTPQSRTFEEMFENCPLMVLAKDPSLVRVYTNVILNSASEDSLKEVSYIFPWPLQTFWDTYKTSMENPATAQGWNTPRRVWMKIKKFEEMPTVRALTRYTNMTKLGLNADFIRDLALGIEEQRKPLQLHWVNSPKDAIAMYDKGQHSCMTNDNAKNHNWEEVLFSHGHHPTSFFFYHPYVQGVYCTFKGIVAARTFVYEKEGGKKFFGRVYGGTKLMDTFLQALKAMGINPLPMYNTEEGKFKRYAKFTIPGLLNKASGHHFMPLPYCDNLHKDIYVEWDGKDFVVTCGDNRSNVNHQVQAGYINCVSLSGKRCKACNAIVPPRINPLIAQDGSCFCSPEHIIAAGYTKALRGDRQTAIIPRNEAYYDEFAEQFFTNIQAARDLGAFPILWSLDEEDENEEDSVTLHGPIVLKNGNYYRLSFDVNRGDQIAAGKMVELAPTRTIWHGAERLYKYTGPEKSPLEINLSRHRAVELLDTDQLFIG